MRLRTMDVSEEATSQSSLARASARRAEPRTEAIHVRNYDHDRGYEIDVEVETGDGEVPFERRYQLRPGQVVSEYDGLPRGTCVVRATMDDAREQSLECRIDDSPEHTASIEVGNGALSLVEGVNGGRRRRSGQSEPRERVISSTGDTQ